MILRRLGPAETSQRHPRRRHSVLRDGPGLSAIAADLQHHRRCEEREDQPQPSMSPEREQRHFRARNLHGLGRPHSPAWPSDGGRGAEMSAGTVLREAVSREYRNPIDFFIYRMTHDYK